MERKNTRHTQRHVRDSVTGYFRLAYLRAKYCWASWLERRAARISRTRLCVLIAVFLLTSGSYFVFLAVRGFTSQADKAVDLVPIKTISAGGIEKMRAPSWISKNEYEMIVDYGGYLDSLQRYSPKAYDSLIRARPGLPDSIKIVRNYYESNYKKEKNGK